MATVAPNGYPYYQNAANQQSNLQQYNAMAPQQVAQMLGVWEPPVYSRRYFEVESAPKKVEIESTNFKWHKFRWAIDSALRSPIRALDWALGLL